MKPKTLQVKIRASMAGKAGEEEEPVLLAMPAEGAPAAQVLQRMRSRVLPGNSELCATALHACRSMRYRCACCRNRCPVLSSACHVSL